jgi:hypothetical protein
MQSDDQLDIGEFIDTDEDKNKYNVLRTAGGIVQNQGQDHFYQIAYGLKKGHYNPVVLFDTGAIFPILDNADILLEARAYESLKEIPKSQKYQYFDYNGYIYKFSKPIFINDCLNINIVNNDAIQDVINKRQYTKEIYEELKETTRSFFYHKDDFEFDVICSVIILSYIKHIIGRVFYLVLLGGMGTGKSTLIYLLSHLQLNGYFTGEGTIPSTARLIHLHDISLSQDEFEKMSSASRMKLVNVFNTGFNRFGKYTFTNMGKKDIKEQILGLDTFCCKSFTCNSLTGFDTSFIDRLYVIIAVKSPKSLKDIHLLSAKDRKHFQNIRNKLFTYTLFNWNDIVDCIEKTKRYLEKKGLFGRETDKNSIILGIIRHFKGFEYAKQVESHIANKAPVLQLEYVRSMELIVLTSIVNECKNKETEIVKISNSDLYEDLINSLKLGAADKYAPSDQKPRKILDNLGLTCRKDNLGYNKAGRRVYRIYTKELVNVLEIHGYNKLLKKLQWYKPLSPLSPVSLKETKALRGAEGKKNSLVNFTDKTDETDEAEG